MYSEAFDDGAVGVPSATPRRSGATDAARKGLGPKVLVIDTTRRLIEATAGGWMVLAEGTVLQCSFDRIVASTRADSARLNAALAQTQGEGHARIAFEGRGERLEADLVTIRRDDAADPHVMVILKPANDARSRCLSDAERRFGLTPAEGRLLAALFEGCSIPQAAERMGVARTTARTHLQRVFDKTGMRRQGDLLRLVGCL